MTFVIVYNNPRNYKDPYSNFIIKFQDKMPFYIKVIHNESNPFSPLDNERSRNCLIRKDLRDFCRPSEAFM